jgi:GNAT superfamily N-acetyltransferase
VLNHVKNKLDVFEHYHVDKYLGAYGLSVTPKYRGRGISTEVLRARIPFCKAFDIKLSATTFTAPGSQKAAAKVGFVDGASILYKELAKVSPRFDFPNIKSKELKWMCLKIV